MFFVHLGHDHHLFATRLTGDRPERDDERPAGVRLLDRGEAPGAEGPQLHRGRGGEAGQRHAGSDEQQHAGSETGRVHSGKGVKVSGLPCVFQKTWKLSPNVSTRG